MRSRDHQTSNTIQPDATTRRTEFGRRARGVTSVLTIGALALGGVIVNVGFTAPPASAAVGDCPQYGVLFQDTPQTDFTGPIEIDLVTGEAIKPQIPDYTEKFNAVGFNVKNGRYYGIIHGTNTVVSMSPDVRNDQSVTRVGDITNATSTGPWLLGDVSPDGILYVSKNTTKGGPCDWMAVDLNADSPTFLQAIVVIPVLDNDAPGDARVPLVPTSVRLIDPGTKKATDTLVVPGEGTYAVDTKTGKVSFTSAKKFLGKTTPVTYLVQDANGTEARTVIDVTVQNGILPITGGGAVSGLVVLAAIGMILAGTAWRIRRRGIAE